MKYEFINGIKRNESNGGICAHIRTEDCKHYYADLAYTLDRGIEFMVFSACITGRVTNWGELFASYPPEISEEVFVQQVEMWLKEMAENETHSAAIRRQR